MDEGNLVERRIRADVRPPGGWLCLDFANTLSPRPDQAALLPLRSYADLVVWARYGGILAEAQAGTLLAAGAADPVFAEAVLAHALALRGAIYGVLLAHARGLAPEREALDCIGEANWAAMSRARLRARGAGFAWSWPEGAPALDRPLWDVARSAVELLTSPAVGRVKLCAEPGCGRLFLDTGRAGGRRRCGASCRDRPGGVPIAPASRTADAASAAPAESCA